MTLPRFVSIGFLAGLIGTPVVAQSPFATAFDVSLGAERMHASTPHVGGHVGPALDLTVSRWRQRAGNGAVVFAVATGIQGGGARDLLCVRQASGGCTSPYPEIVSLSALAGWQTANERVRAFAGPALVYADEAGPGLQARVDVGMPLSRRVLFVVNARGMTIPSMQRSSYQLLSLSAGLRVRSR